MNEIVSFSILEILAILYQDAKFSFVNKVPLFLVQFCAMTVVSPDTMQYETDGTHDTDPPDDWYADQLILGSMQEEEGRLLSTALNRLVWPILDHHRPITVLVQVSIQLWSNGQSFLVQAGTLLL